MSGAPAGRAFPPRLGIVVVDNDPVPEMEIWQRAAARASIHTVRFALPRQPGEIYLGSSVDDLIERAGLGAALDTLRRIRVDAACLCFTSASVFSDGRFDAAFIRDATARAGCAAATTSAQALVHGLRKRGARAPALLIPPWYSDATVDAFEAYFDRHALAVRVRIPFQLPPRWHAVPTQDRFDRGAVWEVAASELVAQVEQALAAHRHPVDAIVVPGSGFPSLHAVDAIEQRLGLPMVSANSASLEWFVDSIDHPA
jgi:maleate isomerase